MGDMADDCIMLSLEDYDREWEEGIGYANLDVQCKFCKARNLQWIELPEGWRLHEVDGTQHKCSVTADELAKLWA